MTVCHILYTGAVCCQCLSVKVPSRFARMCLLGGHVYQMSTKKDGEPLISKGSPPSHFLDVYQMSTSATFSIEKALFSLKAAPFCSFFQRARGVIPSLRGWYAFFSPLTAGFFPVFGILIRQKTRLRPVEGPRQSTGAAPSTQAKKYSTRLFFRRLARAEFRPLLCFGISSGPAATRPVFLKAGQKSKRRNIR